ncbi:MAG: hypothetical protein R3223_02255 [Longimicrobiales bacterium]|nr:hypothetical protein [Longimicrobiales bacterium]
MIRSVLSSWKALCAVAILSTTTLIGCAHQQPDNPMQAIADRESPVRVTVQNQDFYDAVIYAHWGGSTKERVGMVTGKTTQTFEMDWRSETVRFEADFVSGGSVFFDPIDVWGGDHLDLVVMIQG